MLTSHQWISITFIWGNFPKIPIHKMNSNMFQYYPFKSCRISQGSMSKWYNVKQTACRCIHNNQPPTSIAFLGRIKGEIKKKWCIFDHENYTIYTLCNFHDQLCSICLITKITQILYGWSWQFYKYYTCSIDISSWNLPKCCIGDHKNYPNATSLIMEITQMLHGWSLKLN